MYLYQKRAILPFILIQTQDLPINYSEKDFQKGLLENMKNFILELGKDFTFVGNEYKVKVGNEDYYIDLLFYHRELKCLVAFELKIDKFKPEYISKMDFYLEALDILTADVYDKIYIRTEKCRCLVVGNCFNYTVIYVKTSLDKFFTITCNC